MPWFHNEESGQTFEAVGYWEKEARDRGYEEVPDPSGKPAAKAEEPDLETMTNEEAQAAIDSGEAETPSDAVVASHEAESEPEPEKKPAAKGGKEKK